ncbi:MAG: gamma-glutamyltransferase, partial [Lachnospiraceae bacterium]|nr:gamma-glutamyltransferase [Lachnospiraceae bacterium]
MEYRFDPLFQKYTSQRYPIYARGGMVNASSPQASAAGLKVLLKGGNAMDAAVAAAAALTVTEPASNGLGSDAFALIWSEKDKKLYGLNSSGRSPKLISAEKVMADGYAKDGKMPIHGWAAVTVPGAVKAWSEINRRFGRLSLSEDLEPAVKYAREGYPLAPNLARIWQGTIENYKKIFNEPCYDAWFKTFTWGDKPLKAGDIVRLPDHADTLEAIGESDAKAFYEGEIARKIDAESQKYGGYLRYEDLAAHSADWVEPIRASYRGYEVCEIPPNGQGIVALMALNILKEFDFKEKECAETYHRQIEAIKMAFADAFKFVTDPEHMEIDYHDLLRPEYGAMRAAEMTDRAQVYTHSVPPKSGTVYMCCADGEGNMVSYIQSNYWGFGSGIVVGGTGIALQNRGADFSLDPAAANYLKPGKRTYHTIIPGFIMKDGLPVGPFGVMGGYMQPQGHLQVAMNFIDFGLDPQQALDAPRWQWMRDGRMTVESRFDDEMARALIRRGHKVSCDLNTPSFGRGQMIVRTDDGVLIGGTESRTDSNISCFCKCTAGPSSALEPKKENGLRVLFIGNSHTYFNDMPETFARMCEKMSG